MELQKVAQESNDTHESCKENIEYPSSSVTSVPSKKMSDYVKLTVSQLKDECRAKGLLVSGNKGTLVQRLLNPKMESSKRSSSSRKQGLTVVKVHKLLLEAGITNPESKSRCLKRAIQRGFVLIDGKESLQQIIAKGRSPCCGREVKGTVEQLLDQVCLNLSGSILHAAWGVSFVG